MNSKPSENNKKGYKTIIKRNSTIGRSKIKLPLYCPREECKMITSNLDNESLYTYGVCLHCFVTLIENREKPLIDIEFYKKRLQERGY